METTIFDSTLRIALARWELAVSTDELAQLRAHYVAVIEANRTLNLTRIVEPAAAAVKHYADSLALCLWTRSHNIETDGLLDIGTGAGFPAVPLAVLRSDWRVTAIDARRKKAEFLSRTAAAMGLGNLRVEHAHARHWRPAQRFPIVVLRAVARLPTVLQEAARHVASGGWLVSYQTARTGNADGADVERVARSENLHLEQAVPYTLLMGEVEIDRILRVYRKI